MDILYIIGPNSKTNNFELRCSLRSLETYGGNSVDRIFVAGTIPEWVNKENVIAMPYEQPYGKCKGKNILSTIVYVAENSDISDEFLVSMDDHFYLDNVDFNNYPIFRRLHSDFNPKYLLPDNVGLEMKSPEYAYILFHTRIFLEQHNLPYNLFTIHKNMHCYKQDIIEAKNTLLKDVFENEDDVEGMVILLNYRYNKEKFDFVDKVDNKSSKVRTREQILANDVCFSTPDFEIDSPLYKMLEEFYPNKSKYEL